MHALANQEVHGIAGRQCQSSESTLNEHIFGYLGPAVAVCSTAPDACCSDCLQLPTMNNHTVQQLPTAASCSPCSQPLLTYYTS